MKHLFTIDKKNYPPQGTVGRRPSVRGIIQRNGKLAMIHSLKYDYYKFPGGGMEEGESLEDTLIREVREESGLNILPHTIREFGCVRRIERGLREDIFLQENFYFFCEAEDTPAAQLLDDYEAEERFTLEFVSPAQAIRTNENALAHLPPEKTHYPCMLEREIRVLQMIERETKE